MLAIDSAADSHVFSTSARPDNPVVACLLVERPDEDLLAAPAHLLLRPLEPFERFAGHVDILRVTGEEPVAENGFEFVGVDPGAFAHDAQLFVELARQSQIALE